VLFAPGIRELDQIRELIASVDLPVNVLAMPGMPSVGELGEAGVSRVSVGGGFAFTAYGAAVNAGRELLEGGTYGFWETGAIGGKAAHDAFRA
jgi:2-methylisocitrate lyase-like PEP mutase family enzyme